MNKRMLAVLTLGLASIPLIAFADETVVVQPSSPTYAVEPSTPAAYPPAATVVPAQPSQTTVVTPPPVNVQVNNNTRNDDDDYYHRGWGQIEISGGKALFQGSSRNYLDDSPDIDLGFFGPIRRGGQYGLEFGYLTGANLKGSLPDRLNPTVNGLPGNGTFTTDVSAHILRVTPELRFGPQIKAGGVGIMPYLAAGGGFYWTRYNSSNINFSNGSGTLASNDDYNGGWNAGGGIIFGFTHGIGISGDIRYHDIIYSHGPDTTFLLPEGKLVIMFD